MRFFKKLKTKSLYVTVEKMPHKSVEKKFSDTKFIVSENECFL